MSSLVLERIFAKENFETMKKFLVLGVLFLLPITAYIFFASGVNNFAKLPVLTEQIDELSNFKSLHGDSIQLQNKITVLGFLGSNLMDKQGNAFNLAHKIYKKNHAFHDFQFVILLPEGTETTAKLLEEKLELIEEMEHWKFAFGSPEDIESIFASMKTNLVLDNKKSTPYVFIIDKERNLRGRKDDEDLGVLYGFDARDVAELNNKMMDDVDIILAEYRLALKKNNKYKADREI